MPFNKHSTVHFTLLRRGNDVFYLSGVSKKFFFFFRSVLFIHVLSLASAHLSVLAWVLLWHGNFTSYADRVIIISSEEIKNMEIYLRFFSAMMCVLGRESGENPLNFLFLFFALTLCAHRERKKISELFSSIKVSSCLA